MEISVDAIKRHILKLGESSKAYVNIQSKNFNTGEYIRQIWLARGLGKEKAKKTLIADIDMEENLLNILAERHLLSKLVINDGDTDESRYFLLPTSFELYKLLEETEEVSINLDLLNSLIAQAERNVVQYSIEEILRKIKKPLNGTDKMTAKTAIFCYFLLLAGAVSENTAFILQVKEEDNEFVLQDEVVRLLDELSNFIFSICNTKNRQFKRGDLSDFIRRNKEIRDTFGNLFVIDNNLFYFHVYESDGTVNYDNLRAALFPVLKRIKHFAVETEKLIHILSEAVVWYRINNPVKQAHKKMLFVGEPEPNYYPILAHYVNDVFQEIENDAYDDEDEEY